MFTIWPFTENLLIPAPQCLFVNLLKCLLFMTCLPGWNVEAGATVLVMDVFQALRKLPGGYRALGR